jgi:hypothetical protein
LCLVLRARATRGCFAIKVCGPARPRGPGPRDKDGHNNSTELGGTRRRRRGRCVTCRRRSAKLEPIRTRQKP